MRTGKGEGQAAQKQGRRVEGTGNSAELPAGSRGIMDSLEGSRKKFAGEKLALFPVPSTLRPCV